MAHPSSLFRTALVGLLLVGAAACGEPAGSTGPSAVDRPVTLAGTSWSVVSVGGRTPVPVAVPTVTFTATDIGGSGGCNQYGGTYRYDGATGRITVGELRMTAMACLDQARNEFETRFVQALGGASAVTTADGGRIVLSGGSAGEIVLAPGIAAGGS